MNSTRRKFLVAGTAGAAAVAIPSILNAEDAVAEQVTPSTPSNGMLAGQVAFVTGAARGIGRAIAVALAQAGADIAAVDILADIPTHSVPLAEPVDMQQTQQLVEQAGQRLVPIKADVRDLAALKAAVAQTEQQLGEIDIAIANAGINSNVGFLSEDESAWQNSWETITDVNVMGVANTLRAVLPGMGKRQSGRVVITSSTFGRQGNGQNPAYVTSKWGVVGLTKAAAIEMGPLGVNVNAIAPTAVRTQLGGPRTPQERAESDEWLIANYHQLPVGLLEPEDIAGSVVFLVSPAAQHITGVTIDVAAGANARYTA
ncbi:mycofactocin-coupled SDR family oxidoreductase [Oscillatoriales cyanobacterium LEGE 11467]|uniref:Mycofactocin-coupled SDR family oxidoreductase n=1 Tax=Zarconia navalis LEGE 11467 TaxID=1828826 RepID=A0A928ZA14_9CYAN|nr:SDR family NAD(P)-dependent oxidoreductase [Zarconia navalis]MBE9042248.1 mycofactocin-coupled SDR family oxidoreductase [Zarconia navalis LEGE 11467]